ncbi:MAG: transposase [Cellvibrionaceae bacterium]
MARLPRPFVAGCSHHIIQRGNNRQACFFDDMDYAVYLDKLKEYSQRFCVEIHAYVLMTNHVHLLATPSDAQGLSKMMQSLGRYYVRYINSVYQRSGTLWEGRFKSSLVDSETYLLTLYRYIELNPVRACMVDHAGEYPWSSFQYNAIGKDIELVTPHKLYHALGKTKEERQVAYKALFKGRMGVADLDKIRHSINKGRVLGDNRFTEELEAMANRRLSFSSHGGDRKSKRFKNKRNQQL